MMKKRTNLLFGVIVLAIFSLVFAGCPEVNQNGLELGSISGKALFNNSTDHSGITVTLEKTDGPRSVAAISAARSISQGARSINAVRSIMGGIQTDTDGSFSFTDLEPGFYTIYASSQDSKERAVAINVPLAANQSLTDVQLNLTPVGSISGRIKLDNNDTNNFGFLVSVAGTSYMAITDNMGNFVISDVPVGGNYFILIMKGNYTAFWDGTPLSVSGGVATPLGTKQLISSELIDSFITIGSNGNWHINGVDTGVPAQGEPGKDGKDGKDGAPGSIVTICEETGNWLIDGVDTGIAAQGEKGSDGKAGSVVTIINGNWHIDGEDTSIAVQGEKGADGHTPVITIVDGYWFVDGVTTGVSAIGQTGADGHSPVITIVDGYWFVDGVTTGVSAIGQTGADGHTPVITIVDGNWYIDDVDTGVSATGLAGVSIVWKGELAEAPSSPQENWAYFNTTDRTSYIWNVTANNWDILAQSGSSTPQVPATTLILSDTKKILYWPDEAFVFTDADIIGWLYNGHILTNLLDKTHNITLNGDPINNGDPVPTASGEYEIIVTHWSGRTSTFTITVNGTRTIVVDMYDSNSDGWDHSGALRVNINGIDQTVRLNSGGFGSQTLTVNPGDEVNVYWTGNSGSFHNENAFIFYWEDAPPSPAFNATSWSGSNALLFRLRGSLSNANLNQLLGSFIITASGGVESLTTYTATANGSASTTTTQITLSFSADPVGLTIADITLGGSITKGSATLSGSGTTRTISGFTVNSSGNATITITRSGIESGQKSVSVFLASSGSLHEMVLIPSGNFQRDSSTVTLTGFYMGKYQVTQEQYQAVMGSNPSSFSSSPATGEIQGRRPVETVSWYDAIVFCNWLSIAEGLSPAYSINGSTNPNVWGTVPTSWNTTWNAVTIVSGSTGYRLPTEAQWEYACRAGTTTTYYWGNQTDAATVGQYAWYSSNSNSRTHEVGKKLPNNFGLYDMSGNVLEWCWDWYDTYPSGNQTDPVGASSGSNRVIRGGNWLIYVEYLQSAFRNYGNPGVRFNNIGFRVLRP